MVHHLLRARVDVGRYIFCCFGLKARFLEETEIAEPIDKPELPGAKGRIVAVGQAPRHASAVTERIARMPSIAIKMHFDIRHSDVQHGTEILNGPHSMNLVA